LISNVLGIPSAANSRCQSTAALCPKPKGIFVVGFSAEAGSLSGSSSGRISMILLTLWCGGESGGEGRDKISGEGKRKGSDVGDGVMDIDIGVVEA
ncbi:hypothetical protein Tco_0574582, partial [Tanacetum coccineum]